MTDAEINRMVAQLAARNCYARGETAPEELMAEAIATDTFFCSPSEMAKLLDAEMRKVRGQSLGGFVAAVRRRGAAA